MSQKGMKLTGIIQKPNQYPESNLKYQPLRKNIQQTSQKIIQTVTTDISNVSLVSKRLKSLSPQQKQIIKNNTFIPLNCRLKITENTEKKYRATSQKYLAINVEEKHNQKPITPNTFEKVVKNQIVEVVYQYNCPLSEQNNLQQSSNLNNTNTLIKNQAKIKESTQNRENKNNTVLRNQHYFGPSQGQNRTTVISRVNQREIQQGFYQPASKNISDVRNQANIRSSQSPRIRIGGNQTIIGQNKPPTTRNTNIEPKSRQNQISSYENGRNQIKSRQTPSSLPNKTKIHQEEVQLPPPPKSNIYTEHRSGGYNYYQYSANDDNRQLDGPAFYQNEGRGQYNQIGRYSKQQFDDKSRAKIQPANIELGGRSKSTTKQTFEEFESNIGINSRHNKTNMNSTKQHSNHPTKQDILQGQQTQIRGNYAQYDYGDKQYEKSKVRDYVENVESRIVIGEGGKIDQSNEKSRKKIQNQNQQGHNQSPNNQINQSRSPNAKITNGQSSQGQISIGSSSRVQGQLGKVGQVGQVQKTSPEIQQRNRKLQQYQQSGNRGYTFKNNEQAQSKRKKQEYKYNLFSVIDEQTNLKCATGFCTPNQVCASQPKRQGWK